MGKKAKFETVDDLVEGLAIFLRTDPKDKKGKRIESQGQLNPDYCDDKEGRSIYKSVGSHWERLEFNDSEDAWIKIIEKLHFKKPEFKYFKFTKTGETRTKWTIEKLTEAANEYLNSKNSKKTRGGWQKYDISAYSTALRYFEKNESQTFYDWCEELGFIDNYWTLEKLTEAANEYLNSKNSPKTRVGWVKYNNSAYSAANKYFKEKEGKTFYDWCEKLGFIDGDGSFSDDEYGFYYILDAASYYKVGIAKAHNPRDEELNKLHGSATLYKCPSDKFSAKQIKKHESEWKKSGKKFTYVNSLGKTESFEIPWVVEHLIDDGVDGYTETFPKDKDNKYLKGFLNHLLEKGLMPESTYKNFMTRHIQKDSHLNYSVFYQNAVITDSTILKLLSNKEYTNIDILPSEKKNRKNSATKFNFQVFTKDKKGFMFTLTSDIDLTENKGRISNAKIITTSEDILEKIKNGIKETEASSPTSVKINQKQLDKILEECDLDDYEIAENGSVIYRNSQMDILVKKEDDKYIITDKLKFKSEEAHDLFYSLLDEFTN